MASFLRVQLRVDTVPLSGVVQVCRKLPSNRGLTFRLRYFCIPLRIRRRDEIIPDIRCSAIVMEIGTQVCM